MAQEVRRFSTKGLLAVITTMWLITTTVVANDGDVLPFPPTPTASKVGETILDSTMKWRKLPRRLPKDAPNIVIILIDDVGFSQNDTFGGEIHTPTLTGLASQ